jgi:large subunit ribosomal protein L12e
MGGPPGAPEVAQIVIMRTAGGVIAPASALAPKIGPLGLSPKKVGEDIMKATKDWKGQKVTVQLSILNRQATVSIVPSASSLVIKGLKEPVRDRKKGQTREHHGNMTLDEVIDIARVMRSKSQARELKGTVKEILGTCNSVGCTVNGESPTDIQKSIDEGEVEIPEE